MKDGSNGLAGLTAVHLQLSLSKTSGCTKLRVAFAGTPDFILPVLSAIHNSRHELLACWTQPERPAGRGLHKRRSAIKAWASQLGIAVHQPAVWDETQLQILAELQLDIMLVMSYGLMLPPSALQATRLGCVGLHPSLLPRWRGAAPVARTIEAGDQKTGLTLMQMTERLDAGAIIKQLSWTLDGTETGASLNQEMAQTAASFCVEFLDDAEAWCENSRQQTEDQACYAHKLSGQESWIDWRDSAHAIARKVRAWNPWPVAKTLFNRRELLIWEAEAIGEHDHGSQLAGCLLGQAVVTDDHQLLAACREGILLLGEVQQAGKKRLCSRDFINGLHDRSDLFFSSPR